MNEGMENLTQISAAGDAGIGIHYIAEGEFNLARGYLRDAIKQLDELIDEKKV